MVDLIDAGHIVNVLQDFVTSVFIYFILPM